MCTPLCLKLALQRLVLLLPPSLQLTQGAPLTHTAAAKVWSRQQHDTLRVHRMTQAAEAKSTNTSWLL
jgi:hypothetical protein